MNDTASVYWNHGALAMALLCSVATMNAASELNHPIVDVQADRDSGAWEIVNDGVMGGVSTSTMVITNGSAVFSGTVSLENNGGFASVRTRPARLDCTGCDAVILRVRGDGKRYKFTARTDRRWDSPQYQHAFETADGKWQSVRLPFQNFKASFRGRALPNEPPLDPAKLVSVGILISDKQAGPFRLEIKSIEAVRTEPNPS
jgi:monofunctional biosynthetic peptidoglycan transglycosylase